MIGKLNHVGVATPSIEESVKMYREMLGATEFSKNRVEQLANNFASARPIPFPAPVTSATRPTRRSLMAPGLLLATRLIASPEGLYGLT